MKVCLKLSAFFLIFLSPGAYARDTGARPLPDIVHMWDDPAPDWDKPELFPPVEGLVRTRVFTPSTLSGGFNHHARIIFSKGKFRAIWSNQRYGEDGPGQRVLYSESPDARTWSEPREIVPSLAPEAPWGYSGYFCAAYGFLEHGGKIYACAELLEIPLWKNFEQTKTSDVYTPECAWPVYKYLGHLYREILDDGSFGKLFSMSPEKITGKTLFPIDSAANVAPDLKEPAKKYSIKHALAQNPDKRRFCEPAIWRARDGKWVLLLRDDSRSYRKWVAYSDDGKNW
ncbi:MAG: exo-alpha-sialidase, partial [Opitutales bacterium]|nr:exo-alpha-sialidase [Opitutales bacterium]